MLMGLKGNQKGQSVIAMMFIAVMALIVLYAVMAIYVPVYDDLIDPLLDNIPYGSTIGTIVEFLPLMLGIAVLAIPILYFSGGSRPQAPPPY